MNDIVLDSYYDKDLKQLFLHDDKNYLIFNTETLSIYKTNRLNYKEIKEKKIKIENRINKLSNLNEKNSLTKLNDNYVNYLDRITINVSNDCNLKCIYCYASGGSYKKEKGYMDKFTALQTINFFIVNFDVIKNVQFFGGEPLLNKDLIEIICEEFYSKYKNNEISYLPMFSVVTNGTIMSKEIINILSKYDIKITISIDGPEKINDFLRGKGTYNKILKNIDTLKLNNIKFGIECTFTKYHLKNKCDMVDLLDFFYKKLRIHYAHIPTVSISKKNDLYIKNSEKIDIYKKVIMNSLQSLENEDYKMESITYRILRSLILKTPIKYYCPAGKLTLSVSHEGDVYPCFMFIGDDKFLIGNVFKGIYANKLEKVSNILMNLEKNIYPKCKNCWAASLCFGCIGDNYITSNKITSDEVCNFNKEIIKYLILNIINLYNNPNSIKKMINIIKSHEDISNITL